MWSPKRSRNGAYNQFYENMTHVGPGDIVFSFRRTLISDVGFVEGVASVSPKPDFGGVGEYWADEGWLVPVRFESIANPFRPKDYIKRLRPLLAKKYAPLQSNGDGLQSVYLAEVSEEMASVLFEIGQISPMPLRNVEFDAFDEPVDPIDLEPPSTENEQLVRARRGQGIFRAHVGLFEDGCRLTGTTDKRFLIASHIKPWRSSTSIERLDGANGLLLAPHVDHLFDAGWISFERSGALLVSPDLPTDLLVNQWQLASSVEPNELDPRQETFMSYHRKEIFRG